MGHTVFKFKNTKTMFSGIFHQIFENLNPVGNDTSQTDILGYASLSYSFKRYVRRYPQSGQGTVKTFGGSSDGSKAEWPLRVGIKVADL